MSSKILVRLFQSDNLTVNIGYNMRGTFDSIEDSLSIVKHLLHGVRISSLDEMFVTNNGPSSTS